MNRFGLIFGMAVALATAAPASLAAEGPGAKGTESKRIALSNSYAGNSWRQLMLRTWDQASKGAIDGGIIKATKVVNANNSAPEQATQIENLILEGWDAIVINAASPTALNGTIDEACKANIVVVVFDGIATAPCAYKVSFDFVSMGTQMTEFLGKLLGGKGNVINVRGIAGVSVDEEIEKGVQQTLKQFPDIKVVSTVNGNFTPTVAQKEVSAVLPSLPKIDGVLSQGGGFGAYQAFKAAGREIPPIIFGNYQEELEAWKELKKQNQNYRTMSLSSAPGVASVALWVAQQVLAGKDVPKEMTVPLLVITDENLDQWAAATPKGAVAPPVYSKDWTIQMIDANIAKKPLPPAPVPTGSN
jgi:ribose transport system substrate-binding protein